VVFHRPILGENKVMKSTIPSYLDERTAKELEARIPTLQHAQEQVAGVQNILQSLSGFAETEEALRWCLSDLESAIADIEEKLEAWNEERRPIPNHDRDRIVLASFSGNYPWDVWERRAMTEGVAKELAALGRSLMREAYQHSWDEEKCNEAGWNDRGEAMVKFALQTPSAATFRWRQILEWT
jgi:hypothetical protein